MPPLPEEADDDTLTPAVSKHGAEETLPTQQQQPLASQGAAPPVVPAPVTGAVKLQT